MPLKLVPDDTALWTRLLKMYLALHQFDRAISTAQDKLFDERGDKGRTLNALGIAHYIKGEIEQAEKETRQAAIYFKDAMELRPEDKEIRRNLAQALEALNMKQALEAMGGTKSKQKPLAQIVPDGSPKAATTAVEVESFYWVE